MNDHPLAEAMQNGAVDKLDARGLWPLDDARAFVRAHHEFRKGEVTFVRGSAILESDRLWAALLSLEDDRELVREATRLKWFFHPRAKDNVDMLERYGEGILPWLETFIHADGILVDVPWCVVHCLNALGGEDLFAKLWAVKTVLDVGSIPGPGPFAADSPGDFDKLGIDLPSLPNEPDESANGMVIGWIWSQPEERFPMLAKKASSADARARIMLKSLAQVSPSEVFGFVSAALGPAESEALFAMCDAPMALDTKPILQNLDHAASTPGLWPVFYEEDPSVAYLAMRLVAYRERAGDGWAIVVDRVEGSDADEARTRPFVYGTVIGPGWIEDAMEPLGIFEDDDSDDDGADGTSIDLDGVTVVGPSGPLVLSNADHEALDLRALYMTEDDVDEPRFTVLARAYLQKYPDCAYRDPIDLGELLGMSADDWEVIVVTRAMAHVIGTAAPTAPYDDASLRVLPSGSATYRSLAKALVERDTSAFEPGVDNLDFRDHAKVTTTPET